MHIHIQRLDKTVPLPAVFHDGDAGIDLPSRETVSIEPGTKRVIPTGIKLAIPDGYVGLIWDRSGLAAKHALTCLAGVIDSGYRGEIGVVLVNLGTEVFEVEKGMRIAQLLVQPVVRPNFVEVDAFEETVRGSGGFGSTGTH